MIAKIKITDIINGFNQGDISLIDATIKLREIRSVLEECLNDIKNFEDHNLENFEQYKGQKYQGYSFDVMQGRKMFDYSKCSYVKDAADQLNNAQEIAKSAFAMYEKTGQRPITEDGELIDLPEVKFGKSYLKVSKTK